MPTDENGTYEKLAVMTIPLKLPTPRERRRATEATERDLRALARRRCGDALAQRQIHLFTTGQAPTLRAALETALAEMPREAAQWR